MLLRTSWENAFHWTKDSVNSASAESLCSNNTAYDSKPSGLWANEGVEENTSILTNSRPNFIAGYL